VGAPVWRLSNNGLLREEGEEKMAEYVRYVERGKKENGRSSL
jgi:hypothetical protein